MINEKSFTMIELLIVIVIICILSAIALPIMSGNIKKAKQSEAIVTLGTIRTAEQLYYIEYGSYVSVNKNQWAAGPLSVYMKDTYMNGRYTESLEYSVSATTTTFIGTFNSTAQTTGSGCLATTRYFENIGIITMDQNGSIGY